jgi:hypothetical protein
MSHMICNCPWSISCTLIMSVYLLLSGKYSVSKLGVCENHSAFNLEFGHSLDNHTGYIGD